MINRTLIRTRVLQLCYASRSTGSASLSEAQMSLKESIEGTYDLYLFLLKLLPELTVYHSERQELRKLKRFASKEELNPNRRWAENRASQKIEASEVLSTWYNKSLYDWLSDAEVVRRLVAKIEASDFYTDYKKSEDSFSDDLQFILNVFRKVVAQDRYLSNYLEGLCPYWDSELEGFEKIECEERPKEEEVDETISLARSEGRYSALTHKSSPVAIVKEFVDKTIRSIEEGRGFDEILMPMYRDESDERYANHLLRQVLLNQEEYGRLIAEHINIDRWEKERLALMDTILMEMAIAEMLNFPNIPVEVTINEYIELSKQYSTPNSHVFINGVLDAVAKQLRAENRILK